jgi:hypothetical protein
MRRRIPGLALLPPKVKVSINSKMNYWWSNFSQLAIYSRTSVSYAEEDIVRDIVIALRRPCFAARCYFHFFLDSVYPTSTMNQQSTINKQHSFRCWMINDNLLTNQQLSNIPNDIVHIHTEPTNLYAHLLSSQW